MDWMVPSSHKTLSPIELHQSQQRTCQEDSPWSVQERMLNGYLLDRDHQSVRRSLRVERYWIHSISNCKWGWHCHSKRNNRQANRLKETTKQWTVKCIRERSSGTRSMIVHWMILILYHSPNENSLCSVKLSQQKTISNIPNRPNFKRCSDKIEDSLQHNTMFNVSSSYQYNWHNWETNFSVSSLLLENENAKILSMTTSSWIIHNNM